MVVLLKARFGQAEDKMFRTSFFSVLPLTQALEITYRRYYCKWDMWLETTGGSWRAWMSTRTTSVVRVPLIKKTEDLWDATSFVGNPKTIMSDEPFVMITTCWTCREQCGLQYYCHTKIDDPMIMRLVTGCFVVDKKHKSFHLSAISLAFT